MPNVRSVTKPREITIDEASVREELLVRRKELFELYRHDLRVGQQTADEGTDDLVDRANNSLNRELMFALSNTERSIMFLIDEALGRLDDGTFGTCGSCGDEIGETRLEAVPWARYCVGCQELYEQGLLEG